MSYSEGFGFTVEHKMASTDFGTLSPASAKISVPPGATRGRLLDVGVRDITETFACDTTTAIVEVGNAGDADAYAKLNIADAVAALDSFSSRDDSDAILEADIVVSDLTANELLLTYTAGTDSVAAAGIGVPYVLIRWF